MHRFKSLSVNNEHNQLHRKYNSVLSCVQIERKRKFSSMFALYSLIFSCLLPLSLSVNWPLAFFGWWFCSLQKKGKKTFFRGNWIERHLTLDDQLIAAFAIFYFTFILFLCTEPFKTFKKRHQFKTQLTITMLIDTINTWQGKVSVLDRFLPLGKGSWGNMDHLQTRLESELDLKG